MFSGIHVWGLILATAVVLGGAGSAPADVVRLQNGGEVRGTLVKGSDQTRDPELTIITFSGATITIARTEVDSVQMRSAAVEEYVTRSREIPHTASAHQQLADWCSSRQLKAQRVEQLEQLLELEPENEVIHRSLGHVRQDGEWLSREESMAKQGYVLHKSKWITHLELELLEKTGAERAAEQVWFPKVKQWAGWLSGRDPRRIAEGLQNLRAIDDPDAVSALWNYLGQQSNPEYRQLFVQVAGQLKGPKPVRRLSQGMLAESNELIFRQALDTIDADQKTEVVKYCLPGLKDKSNDVVQRAAIVVGKFGDERVIPDLIDALITTHRYKIQVPDTSNTIGFGVASNGVPTMLPSGNMAMIPSDIEIMSRLGQLPYGYTVNDPTPKRMRTVSIKTDIRNTKVLAALKGITQQDYGYDQRDWQRWWTLKKAAT